MIESRYPLRPLGEVLELDRNEVRVEPTETYRTAGIYSFGRGLFEREPVLGSDTSYKTLFRLTEGQVVISRLNGWEGALDVVSPGMDGAHVSNEYPTFSVIKGEASLDYLKHLIHWPPLWDAMRPRGSMVRRRRVSGDEFLGLSLPLPDPREQFRVAGLLRQARKDEDEVRRLLRRQCAVSAALAHSLLFPHQRAMWTTRLLADGIYLASERVPVRVDTTYLMAGVYSFGRGVFERGPLDGTFTKYKELHRLRSGNLVMSRLKAWEGALALVPKSFDGWFLSPEFPTFEIDHSIFDASFLGHLISNASFWQRLRSEAKGVGARKERVSADRLLATTIDVPPLQEQRTIGAHLDLLLEASSRSRSQQALDTLDVSILNRAFAGLL